jgi:Ser/Thr protein kinase RdoA (MazF antagonist)
MEGDFEHHPLADHFNRLTPEQVLDAVEVGGRRCTGRFAALNSYENRVYQLELEGDDGEPGSMVVGKFYRPGRWSREAIAEEHRFLAELSELEIPANAPLQIGPGETIGEVDNIFYALFPRVGGRAPQELSDEQVKVLGRLIARIHNVGATRDAPARRRLTPETFGRQNLAFLVENELIHPDVREVYSATVNALLDRMEHVFEGVPVHRIHGDCHLGNLIWAPQGPTFLDFDDMMVGAAVQDVWMMVPSYDADGARQRGLLMDAYREFREFKDAWLGLVEPLRALRYINYSTWIARRFRDPAFQRAFAHFGTQQYWEREVQDLREQIARIDQQSGC